MISTIEVKERILAPLREAANLPIRKKKAKGFFSKFTFDECNFAATQLIAEGKVTHDEFLSRPSLLTLGIIKKLGGSVKNPDLKKKIKCIYWNSRKGIKMRKAQTLALVASEEPQVAPRTENTLVEQTSSIRSKGLIHVKNIVDLVTDCRQQKEGRALKALDATTNVKTVDSDKRRRNLTSTEDELCLCILNERSPDYKITPDEWTQTESEFQEQYVRDDDAPVIDCDGAGWSDGHKTVACADLETAEWLRHTINNLPKDERLSRKAVFFKDLHKFEIRRAWVLVPLPLTTDELFLKLLKKQNPGLSIEGWKIERKSPINKNGQRFVVLMSGESMSFLESREFILNYSVSKIVFNLFRNAEEITVSELDTAFRFESHGQV